MSMRMPGLDVEVLQVLIAGQADGPPDPGRSGTGTLAVLADARRAQLSPKRG
jgi:hypothetical protein